MDQAIRHHHALDMGFPYAQIVVAKHTFVHHLFKRHLRHCAITLGMCTTCGIYKLPALRAYFAYLRQLSCRDSTDSPILSVALEVHCRHYQ